MLTPPPDRGFKANAPSARILCLSRLVIWKYISPKSDLSAAQENISGRHDPACCSVIFEEADEELIHVVAP